MKGRGDKWSCVCEMALSGMQYMYRRWIVATARV